MSSGFITESEATEIRKKRQEEWERVRKADDPIERPEEPYDTRSLYERLQEQKQKKDLEYEEAHKLKNMIKGLDDDEIEFLDLVDRTKMAEDRKKTLEEERELNDYRNRVASLQEKSLEEKLQVNVVKSKVISPASKPSQTKLLMGAVVKKNEPKKRKQSETEENIGRPEVETCKKNKTVVNGDQTSDVQVQNSTLQCIGILPGLVNYNDDSSTDNSSDSEIEPDQNKIDLLGRKIQRKEKDD